MGQYSNLFDLDGTKINRAPEPAPSQELPSALIQKMKEKFANVN